MRQARRASSAWARAILLAAVAIAGSGFTAAAPTRQLPRADLAVSLAAGASAVAVGKPVVFTLTVANRGPSTASGVTVKVALRGGIEVASAPGCSGSATALTCNLGSLGKFKRKVVAIEAAATAIGPAGASATASSRTSEARPADNAARASTTVLGEDTVSGHGLRPGYSPYGYSLPDVSVDVDAASAFDGTDPHGTFATRYPSGDPELHGHVVCLTVAGNRAMVGGIVDTSNNAADPPGSGVLLSIIDNGTPGAGHDAEVSYLGVENAMHCAIQDSGLEITLSDGDFVVHDEHP